MASRSDAVPLNSKCYTDDDKWVVDIYENLLPTNELEELQKSHAVISVCQVPKSLRSSASPDAFIPQFVGLGPYHHYRPELIMTDQLKLAAVKRVLKNDFHLDSKETLRQRLKNSLSHSDIKAFYHIDVSSKYNYHTLLYVLAVDGLFLFSLLHRAAATVKPGEDDSYFLTGKHGMALVNASGVELTMDFIIRDVFMLENQIPTHFLKQIKEAAISNNNEIQPHGEVYKDLDETMQNFCESLCPFVLSEKPFRKPKVHHLLDLMYQLIAPEPEPESDPEPESESMPNPKPESMPKLDQPEPEPAGPQSEDKDEQADTKNRNTCCSMMCFIMDFMVQHILKPLLWILKSLFRIILWPLRLLYNVLVKLSHFIHPLVEALYNFLSGNDTRILPLKPLTRLVGLIKKTSEKVGRDYSTKRDKDGRQVVTIPSATEMHSAGINFQPVKGGISSIDFDHMKCQFYLPVIKLDVNSEVIIRNLVAYESLTKYEGLIFTRYMELMRAIIETPQDVKLLVLDQIIDTKLSDEVVAQLFNGMSKSIRPTKTPKLEDVIKKVNAEFDSIDSIEAQKMAMINCMSTYAKMFVGVVIFVIFVWAAAVRDYCSLFDCSPTSNFAKVPPQGGEYASNNNHLMSSI